MAICFHFVFLNYDLFIINEQIIMGWIYYNTVFVQPTNYIIPMFLHKYNVYKCVTMDYSNRDDINYFTTTLKKKHEL